MSVEAMQWAHRGTWWFHLGLSFGFIVWLPYTKMMHVITAPLKHLHGQLDRVKIPTGMRVPAHTHPRDELVTVIEGTWYLGAGEKFDAAKLKGYPAGSFIVIPAGVPHFVATREGTVVVQLTGTGIFRTDFLEK